jgi:predicted ester cyclase
VNDAATVAKRWMQEVWNEQNLNSIDELLHPEAVGHLETGKVVGIEPFKIVRKQLLETFPDIKLEIKGCLAEGEEVALRFEGVATHATAGIGLAPTGQQIPLRGMVWLRVKNGQIVEGWDCWNLSTISNTHQVVQEHLNNKIREAGLA